jgi:hypothetical protein
MSVSVLTRAYGNDRSSANTQENVLTAASGPFADRDGFIYCMTGNGTFDAVTDWAESFLQLRYTPPAGRQAGAIAVVDWWTAWTDDGRSGHDPSGDYSTRGGCRAGPTAELAKTNVVRSRHSEYKPL